MWMKNQENSKVKVQPRNHVFLRANLGTTRVLAVARARRVKEGAISCLAFFFQHLDKGVDLVRENTTKVFMAEEKGEEEEEKAEDI